MFQPDPFPDIPDIFPDDDEDSLLSYESDKTLSQMQWYPRKKNIITTPGFELIIVLGAIALVLFWKRKLKK